MKWKSLLLAAVAVPTLAQAADWPMWRGPNMTGVAEDADLPVAWSPSSNVVWKTDLPAWSGGTPVVWGDYVFVTSPSESVESDEPEPKPEPNRRRRRGQRRDPGGDELLLIALSRKDGSEHWRVTVDRGNRLWRKGNNTSPSPVTDGKHVWVVAGTGTVAAYTVKKGKQVWAFNLQDVYGDFGLMWGYASSPLLYKDRLIIQILHGMHTDLPSYVAAYDKLTGKRLWKQVRETDAPRESPDAYTTPVVLTHEGKDQIVISGADYVTGHDPDTGEEVWRAAGLNPNREGNYRVVGTPVVADGMVIATTRKKPIIALRTGGTGDITESHLAWKYDGPGAPDVPSAVTDGNHYFIVDDRGLVSCLKAATGATVWGPERTAQGTVSASLALGDGKLFILNENAVTTVVAAGPEYRVLATNELDGSYTLSSPALAGDSIFIRTGKAIYRISKRSS